MYLELTQHANIVALNMNGKINYYLFSFAFGAEKIIPLQILIQLKICSIELTRIIVMEVKIMSEEFILLIYNLAMIDQALEKFEQEDVQ